jgi:Ni/Co efflux regulator RcnB
VPRRPVGGRGFGVLLDELFARRSTVRDAARARWVFQQKEFTLQIKKFACLALAGAMGLGSMSVFAQGYDRDRHDDRRDHQRHEERAMGNRDRDFDRRDFDRRDHDRRDDGRQDVYHYGARGPEWHRGGRLPAQYRDHQYVVDNWRAHRLSAPPRGYHWVQVGNDYVLAAIATGIITQLILGNS